MTTLLWKKSKSRADHYHWCTGGECGFRGRFTELHFRSTCVTVFVPVLLGLILYLIIWDSRTASAEERTKDPAALIALAEQHLADREKLVDALTAVAKDESAKAAERERAVQLISTLATEQGRRFMLNNLRMQVPLPIYRTDLDRARNFPCLLYLSSQDYRDWNTARTMLIMLDEEIPQKHLTWFPSVLEELFRQSGSIAAARAMLEYELKTAKSELRKRQLTYLLEHTGR